MNVKLKPIKPKRISDQVFDQLREIIFRGELKPGEKIMPERELSEVLGVSWTSVRDAISKLGMECNAAALAAQRADKKDIEFLEKSLVDMKKQIKQGKLGNEADVSFHMALSYATKNPLQVYLMKHFFDFLFLGIKENLSHLYEEPANIPEIIKQHTKIVQAIKDKDPEKAYKYMKNHIRYVMDFYADSKTSL